MLGTLQAQRRETLLILVHIFAPCHQKRPNFALPSDWHQEHGRVYGVITAADAVRAFSEHLRGASTGVRMDGLF